MHSSSIKDGTVSNREEVADHIENAFRGAPVEKAELITEARANNAPLRVLDALDRLPDIPLRALSDLWPLLPL